MCWMRWQQGCHGGTRVQKFFMYRLSSCWSVVSVNIVIQPNCYISWRATVLLSLIAQTAAMKTRQQIWVAWQLTNVVIVIRSWRAVINSAFHTVARTPSLYSLCSVGDRQTTVGQTNYRRLLHFASQIAASSGLKMTTATSNAVLTTCERGTNNSCVRKPYRNTSVHLSTAPTDIRNWRCPYQRYRLIFRIES